MENFESYVFAAIAVEGVISWTKTVVVEKKVQISVIVSLVLSLLLVFDLGLNVFYVFGVDEAVPPIGKVVVTAIAVSRGTNYFYEMIERLTKWKQPVAVYEDGKGSDEECASIFWRHSLVHSQAVLPNGCLEP